MTAAEPGERGIPTGMEGKRDGGEAGNAGNASNPALDYPSPRAKPRLMLPENSQLPKSGWDSLPALRDPGKRTEASVFPKKPQEQPGFKRLPLPESAAPGEIPTREWAGKGFPRARAFRGPSFPTSIPDLSQLFPPARGFSHFYPRFIPDLSQYSHFQEAFPRFIPVPPAGGFSHTYPTFIPVYSHLELFPLGTTWRRERLGILTSFLHLSSQNTRSKHSCM